MGKIRLPLFFLQLTTNIVQQCFRVEGKRVGFDENVHPGGALRQTIRNSHIMGLRQTMVFEHCGVAKRRTRRVPYGEWEDNRQEDPSANERPLRQ